MINSNSEIDQNESTSCIALNKNNFDKNINLTRHTSTNRDTETATASWTSAQILVCTSKCQRDGEIFRILFHEGPRQHHTIYIYNLQLRLFNHTHVGPGRDYLWSIDESARHDNRDFSVQLVAQSFHHLLRQGKQDARSYSVDETRRHRGRSFYQRRF